MKICRLNSLIACEYNIKFVLILYFLSNINEHNTQKLVILPIGRKVIE